MLISRSDFRTNEAFHRIIHPRSPLYPVYRIIVSCASTNSQSLIWNSQYRITMAALDPTEAPEADEEGNIPAVPRATLKLIRRVPSLDDEEDDEYLDELMGGSSDEDEDDDDEPNGGPSDPAKSKKARQAAALQKLIQAAQEEEDSDEEMGDAKPNGVKASKKGKEPATSSDDEDDNESVDSEGLELEELVVCTLDTERVSLPYFVLSSLC